MGRELDIHRATCTAGDNSNTQYALLGLNAASEAGIPVRPEVWALSRAYFEYFQNRDGGWGYTPQQKQSTASMTCAGISSLIICGSRRFQSLEYLQGETIRDCGEGAFDPFLNRGIDWLANHFDVRQNLGHGQQYKLYYLYGLERAGRLAGVRFFGQNDWYRLGAEELVRTQNKLSGFWSGGGENEIVGTSLALLFLAKGRAPVLINKLSHLPRGDWNNDADDVRNMVGLVSREWKNLLTWQVVDPSTATIQDMLQAPIAFFNGHNAPEFPRRARQNLREFVEQGGFIFAEACCGSPEFDQGFKRLVKEIFPEDEYRLRPLSPEHPVWRAKHLLIPEIHPLWGIEHGCRTVLIYSPHDLSCYWNQVERSPTNPAVIKAFRVGENVIDYATGREMPADKLAIREVHDFKADRSQARGPANRQAQARRRMEHRPPGDPQLDGRSAPASAQLRCRDHPEGPVCARSQPDLLPTRLHPRPVGPVSSTTTTSRRCGGTSSREAAHCSPTPRAAVRPSTLRFASFVAELLPDQPLVPIPHDDDLCSDKVGFDLKDVEYTKAAGGRTRFSPARRGQDQRPLGDHLLEVRHRLRPRTAHRPRLQGLHALERGQDRRQHRDLRDAAVIHVALFIGVVSTAQLRQ